MNRKKFIQNLTLATAGLTLPLPKLLAELAKADGYEIAYLNSHKTIGTFVQKGGTIMFYYGKKGLVLVDAQFADTVQNLITEMQKVSDKKFTHLINTHHHADHTSGNIMLKPFGTVVVAHANSLANQRSTAMKQKNEDKQYYPTTTFNSNILNLKLDRKETLQLQYLGAGHTNGDILVHFTKANVVHCGDLVFNRRHPYIDTTNGANVTNWIMILQSLQTKFDDNTIFVFGHANKGYNITGNKADIKAFENYLTNVLAYVKEGITNNKTRKELLLTKTIPNSPEWTGDGIERSINAAYSELTNK